MLWRPKVVPIGELDIRLISCLQCFRRLELKLGEQTNWDSQTQNPRPTLYCIMCRHSGHGIRECSESKFFIAQGICRMDLNNRVVMSDGSVLPQAEGEGGAA